MWVTALFHYCGEQMKSPHTAREVELLELPTDGVWSHIEWSLRAIDPASTSMAAYWRQKT